MNEIIFKTILAGIPLVLVAVILGSLIQWRKMAFLGDTVAHSALLGIGISLAVGINTQIGIFIIASLIALYIFNINNMKLISADTALSVCAHVSLAAGVFTLYVTKNRVDWESILFGNILTISKTEVIILVVTTIIITFITGTYWKKLVLFAINPEIAATEIKQQKLLELFFLLMIVSYVTIGVQIVGVLLLNSLLMIPAAAARFITNSPIKMVVVAFVIASISMLLSIYLTFSFDLPLAPVCILIAGGFFCITWALKNKISI